MAFSRLSASLLCALALLFGGCASHRIAHSQAVSDAAAREVSLQTYIASLRHVQRDASVRAPQRAATVESQNPFLKDTLQALADAPSADTLCRVAEAYRLAGILDKAETYYARALTIDRRSAVAYDGLARVWRDGGLPGRGLGDAYRATFYAPHSAPAYNTLGTLLYALGQAGDARLAFSRALAIDPRAAYAMNNVCYLSLKAGDAVSAIAMCRQALDLEPDLTPGRNNLALAYASTGDFASATHEFSQTGDQASTDFNLGMVLSATRRFSDAEQSFNSALTARPGWTAAAARAKQAHQAAERSIRLSQTTDD